MARKPAKVAENETIERLVPIKGWVYNLMIDIGLEQGRNTKYQMSVELEQLARKYLKERERAGGM